MVKYVYDAWGKFLSTTGSLASTLGAIQPFRYRSYMYDQETGLYYLRSRYYNPVLCKFFCADIFICSGNVFDWNKYCYVNNNPVNRIDINGTTSSLAQPFWDFIKRDGMNYCLQDGVLLFGECIVLGAVGLGIFATLADGAVWLWNTIFPSTQSETVTLSSKIDWNSGDHNHIINGSKVNGGHNWGKFGLDPKDPNMWEKLVPFLKTVADYGAQYGPPEQQSAGTVYRFIYDFSDKGASIVLKLFYHNNGNISISDAWPIP